MLSYLDAIIVLIAPFIAMAILHSCSRRQGVHPASAGDTEPQAGNNYFYSYSHSCLVSSANETSEVDNGTCFEHQEETIFCK
jgi:hypothetical protein